MLINLWVRDKSNGHIHQIGTDVHDSIEYMCGQVHYYNLQNGCGTLDEYEWVEAPDPDGYVSVTPEQLLLNRELVHKDVLAMLAGEGNRAASFETEVDKVAEQICDRYCKFPGECKDQDELDKHCDSCVLIKLMNIGKTEEGEQ